MSMILVIDDEEMVLTTIQGILAKLGYSVEIAQDGLEGIRKFDDGSFDMVITDISMPVMDGRAVVEHIRNSHKRSTPVIGISGFPDLLKNLDFDRVLFKPFPTRELIESVRELCDYRESSAATV